MPSCFPLFANFLHLKAPELHRIIVPGKPSAPFPVILPLWVMRNLAAIKNIAVHVEDLAPIAPI
jgi:hypothetical protein